MNHLHRRGLSALLSLLLVGQMLPSALALAPQEEEPPALEETLPKEETPVLEEAALEEEEAPTLGESVPEEEEAPALEEPALEEEETTTLEETAPERTPGPGEVAITPDVFPDDAFRGWLANRANLNGYGADGIFTQEELAEIREIRVPALGIASLEGIQVFTALEALSCGSNRLTELDVSQNRNLRSLRCSYNQISQLDVTGLTRLVDLVCEFNHMSELILSGCTALENLYARHNDLTGVNFSDNINLKFIEIFDNRLESVDLTMLEQLEFVHLDDNRLTELDLSRNVNLSPIGSGFVGRHNFLKKLTLPNRADLMVDPDVYAEQTPQTGFGRVEWYEDETFTRPVTGEVSAQGQTLYAKWLPNDYTIRYDGNGGSGSIPAQAAVWDTPVTLAENAFNRWGYRFTRWENKYGDGQTYAAGQEVTNLSGKNQGDKVTLYAQWKAITYTVVFDPGQGGSGSMPGKTYTYDQEGTLPENTLTAPQGKEFAGWALTPGGPIRYGDRAGVWNLTATEGETVTLYAVWRDPIRITYYRRLETAYSQYQAEDYTARDWAALVQIFDDAQKAIEDASLESGMEKICSGAIRDMAAVATSRERAETVIAAWRSIYGTVIAQADSFAVDESNAVMIQKAADNTAGALTADFVGGVHQDLTEPADLERVTSLVKEFTHETVLGLERLEAAAAWVQGLDGLSVRPLAQVTSQWQSAYETAVTEAAPHTLQLTGQFKTALNSRMALAQQKKQAATQLTADYQSYDPERYSQQGREQLAAVFRTGTDTLESAVSPEAVAAALESARTAFKAVPQKDQESSGIPGGGSAGGGGGSSSGGGSSAGGSGEPGNVVDVPETEPGFSDVPEDFWARQEISWALEQGYMKGTGEGIFTPGGSISRQQIWMILARMEGVDPSDMEAAKAWAMAAGISDGSAPGAAVTRQQLAVLLYRFAQRQGAVLSVDTDLNGFSDGAAVAPYAREAMAWAIDAGVLQGTAAGSLLPEGTASRAQTAVLLSRFCRLGASG